MSIKILLVDDHKIIREGLRSLLEKKLKMKAVAEAEDGRTAVKMVRKFKPDVVVMDIAMPDLNGIEATYQIIANNPNVRIIALSMHSNKQFVKEILKAGASGYLLKDCAFEELTHAIQAVLSNQTYLSPKIADIIVEEYLNHLSEKSSVFSILTPREREVLKLLAEGKTTKQIAFIFHRSDKTIETHRRNIMNKLDIYSIAELTKYAIREGLTFLEP